MHTVATGTDGVNDVNFLTCTEETLGKVDQCSKLRRDGQKFAASLSGSSLNGSFRFSDECMTRK